MNICNNLICHITALPANVTKFQLNDAKYIYMYKTSKSFLTSSFNLNHKSLLNLFHRMRFDFLWNLYQLCLVTCSANTLKHSAFQEFAIKIQPRGKNQRVSSAYVMKVKSLNSKISRNFSWIYAKHKKTKKMR